MQAFADRNTECKLRNSSVYPDQCPIKYKYNKVTVKHNLQTEQPINNWKHLDSVSKLSTVPDQINENLLLFTGD